MASSVNIEKHRISLFRHNLGVLLGVFRSNLESDTPNCPYLNLQPAKPNRAINPTNYQMAVGYFYMCSPAAPNCGA